MQQALPDVVDGDHHADDDPLLAMMAMAMQVDQPSSPSRSRSRSQSRPVLVVEGRNPRAADDADNDDTNDDTNNANDANANDNDNDDEFTTTIERILAAAEHRDTSPPLTPHDLTALSRLCSMQQQQQQQQHMTTTTTTTTNSSSSSSSSSTCRLVAQANAGLGFSDVDPGVTQQLVESLQKHVTLASSVDMIQEGYAMSLRLKREQHSESIDKWLERGRNGRALFDRLRSGLEAATILLFVINSPGMDRSVISEDAIEAAIMLFRHHLVKNLLPAINQVGHITAALDRPSQAAVVRTPSVSAKKRRRSNGAMGGGTNDATIMRDLRKVYKPLSTTVGLTVLIVERLETLVQKIPLDDQPLLNISSGALITLELDPSSQAEIQLSHQCHAAAIGVITSIFRKYPRHRQIIVEDLFPVMLKLPTWKKSLRTYPVQSSSVLFPSGSITLSQSLASVPESTSCIQSISTLLMSLVQSAVVRPVVQFPDHDVVVPGASIQEDAPTRTKTKTSTTTPQLATPTPKIVSGLRDSQSISDSFVAQLLKRCSKKGEEGGASEFRPILSNLIDDLLLVLLIPEYPAAEMILMSLANRISLDLIQMCQSTNKVTAETTYMSTILDALGKICAAEARVLKVHRERPVRKPMQSHASSDAATGGAFLCYCDKTCDAPSERSEGNEITTTTTTTATTLEAVVCEQCQSLYHAHCVGLSRAIMPTSWYCDACQLGRIVDLERDRNTNLGELGCAPELVDESYCMRRLLIDYLSIVARQSGVVGFQDAYEFHLARWLSELKPYGRRQSAARGPAAVAAVGDASSMQTDLWPLIARLMELWDPRESSDIDLQGGGGGGQSSLNGMLHCLSDEGRSRMVVHLASTQSQLLVSHRSQIGLFVNQLMESRNAALLRKLALKAIEKVTDADPKLMIYPFIRKAVTKRFTDEAISVREAAVSLVGLYVVHSPAVANAFHPAFMLGLNDPGVSVRKRTIKTLQDILCTNPVYKGRAAACSEMLRLAADPKEDDGVRDAIHDLFLQVWLENGDETVLQEIASPATPELGDNNLTSPPPPGSRVLDMETVDEQGTVVPITPNGLLTPAHSVRGTRSTERRIKKKRLQIRSEIAAEQMVEVVKAADTGEHLTTLFRELLGGVSDADKGRKTSARRKRRVLAEGHCGMLVDAVFEILLRVEESRSNRQGATAQDVVAVMRTIRVFTDISPVDVHRHLDTILPYLKADNGLPFQQEAVLVASLCHVVSHMAHVLDKDDLEMLSTTSLADDLVKITYKFGREALSSAVCALSALAHHGETKEQSPFRTKLLSLAKTFYGYLLKHLEDEDFAAMKNKAKANVQRALSVLGAICRFHDTNSHEMEDIEETEDVQETLPEALIFSNLTAVFEELFTVYLSKNDAQTKCAALRGLCGVFIAHPREMLRMDRSGLIAEVMAPSAPVSLQSESLVCWREILLTEEARIESGEAKAKMDSKSSITVSKKISGDQDADATLFGGVLTSHAKRLFQMTQVKDRNLRFAALDLIGHLLRQGQINPNETVPFLLALQGDVEEDGIRALALKLLMIEGEKRPDMLRQRVYAGIKQAYAFQKFVYSDIDDVSALVTITRAGVTHTECVFGRVFKECIANMRKQRRGLFSSLLHRFDLQTRKKSNVSNGKANRSEEEKFIEDLPLLSFTGQVLAYLPYKVASDPLFIIYSITSALALRGPDLLDRFTAFLRPYGLTSSDDLDETNYEEDVLEIAAKRHVPRHAKEATPLLENDFDIKAFSSLCAEAAAQTLLLRLKSFLRTAFDISESRIFTFSPDSKAEKERAVSRASQLVFDSKLAMQSTHLGNDVTDIDCMIFQYADFRKLMRAESNIDSTEFLDDEDDDDVDGGDSDRKRRRSSAPDDVEPAAIHSP